jgi:hypothetical protein
MRVFISYAHDDQAHEERVREFWLFLRALGVDARLDLPAAEQRLDLAQWMTQQVRDAELVLVIASPEYRRRAEGDARPSEGRGVQWEARLIREVFYAAQNAGLQRVLPVVLPGCSTDDIPLWLAPTSASHYVVSAYTVAGAEQLLRVLTGQPWETEPPLGTAPALPPRPVGQPGAGSAAVGPAHARGVAGPALSPDVQDAYRRVFTDTPISISPPVSWTLPELSKLRWQVAEATRQQAEARRGAPEVAVTLTALCDALEAKPVFLAIGGRSLGLDRLQVTYRREIGAWPRGGSADALLVEAASAGIVERRDSPSESLGALARFVVGIAAMMGSPPDGNDLLEQWIGSLGHQLADALQHYDERRDDPAWLLIDLGDEPLPGKDFWPTKVIWTRVGPDGPLTGNPVMCEANQDDLKRALGKVLRLVPQARPLLVDLAVPRALMEFGIEHWEIIEVDGVAEPLSADYRPRLRWSKRRYDEMLFNRVCTRLEKASWRGGPKQWMENNPRHACFVGGGVPPSPTDPLRAVLRDGCAFVIWFRAGIPDWALRRIAQAVRKMPVQARRGNLPDYLPAFGQDHPLIIWDDPRGRGDFHLPPIVKPQSP